MAIPVLTFNEDPSVNKSYVKKNRFNELFSKLFIAVWKISSQSQQWLEAKLLAEFRHTSFLCYFTQKVDIHTAY